MKKKYYLITLMLLLALSVVACGEKKEKNNEENKTANADSVVIKIGHVEPENRSTHRALIDFKGSVEEKSKGSITVEIYPNGALGGDVQLTESVAMGTLDVATSINIRINYLFK